MPVPLQVDAHFDRTEVHGCEDRSLNSQPASFHSLCPVGLWLSLSTRRGLLGTLHPMNSWLLQCSPKVWDVFAWWADGDSDLENWTVARHLDELAAGDRFAFWVGGERAGVYAIGSLDGPVFQTSAARDRYWKQRPSGPVAVVPLKVDRYLFDAPVTKATLAADPDFAGALILRMPRTANPIRLSADEWDALMRYVPTGGRAPTSPGQRQPGEIVVTSRPLSTMTETTVVTTPASKRTRHHREARLVSRYEEQVGRTLEVLSVRLDGGTRLVADAFDPKTNTLIEAKASADRTDVRMAIGQLLDYQRHLAPDANLAVLLPVQPSADLTALLQQLGIAIVTADI